MTQTMQLRDYLARMKDKNLFSDNAAFPEHNTTILADFFARLAPYNYDALSAPVTVALDKYALWFDPMDTQRVGKNWALSTSMVDFTLPVTRAEFFTDRDALSAELADEKIMTDTFAFLDGYLLPSETALPLSALNSPVATFGTNFEDYVEGLSQERRKKYRRFVKDFDEYGVTFSLSDTSLNQTEIDFAYTNLASKWGPDGALFAYSQTLWAQSIAVVMPGTALFMRVTDNDKLVFVQTILRRHGGYYAQSIFKDQESFYDGIAPYTDFKTIEALCAKGPSFFDPSCRTGLEDPESIGIAKRATVNKDVIKPVFLAGHALPVPFIDYATTATLHGKAA
jgi:hypothetical protein